MLSSILTSMIMMSIIFTLVNHPLSMGLILLIQSILIALITNMLAHNAWFSYILFMIMVGGMLVLFIYMTSVASNEKFMFSNKIFFSMVSFMFMVVIFNSIEQFSTYYMCTNMDMTKIPTNLMFNLSMSKYINIPLNMWMITLIIYLLLALIAVVKITKITYGPLRQKL
uniref:NADH dehydrogenase subunit 6 n=1 Tax=Agriotes fuscicollis TaxID=941251 RepID=UPI002001768A|nr:NADH dehydrogenase subunit 6 [Agriotes fuscicollis]UNQ87641.1 NADH dehydrogenase subunit 6 [Agriotes fuscicollis]